MRYLCVYLAFISLIAVCLTIYDKTAARRRKRRIKESALFLVSVLGGSAAMWITMRVIHHKTLHRKFMIGIPVILILQIAAVVFFYYG